ncbi:DsbA family protein [Chelativorans composti]
MKRPENIHDKAVAHGYRGTDQKEPHMTTPITVQVYSDVVCPWCFLGMRNLLDAWPRVGHDAMKVEWRPFILDPNIPAGGVDRQQYMLSKFGSKERIDAAHDRLREMGAQVGLAFDFDAIKVSPNTLDAHRLIHWAGRHGPERQSALVARLFRAYFQEGKDVGNRDVLVQCATDAGMDAAHARELLETDAHRKDVLEAVAAAQRMGITGVPCFILENRYVISGAQPAEVLEDAIRQVAALKERGKLDKDF